MVGNQLYNKMFPQSNTVNGITFTVNDDGSITANGTSTNTVYYQISDYMSFNNHVAYLSGCPSGGSAETYRIYLDTTPFSDTGNGCIDKLTIESKRFFINIRTGVTVNNLVFRPQIIDLTKMLPSAIADHAYTLEQATAGSGIAWLKSYGFFDDYQAYNAGSLQSVQTSAHKMVGFNLFDESDDGEIVGNKYRFWDMPIGKTNQLYMTLKDTGAMVDMTDISFGFAKEIAAGNISEYVWVLDSGVLQSNHTNIILPGDFCGAVFMYPKTAAALDKLRQKYNICINLSDPAKNGTYKPYTEYSYTLDDTLTLRGIPKLSNGEIYYDGDTYAHDGTVTRRYALVDLGTLNWTYATTTERFNSSSLTQTGKGNTINGLCSIYHVGVLAYADSNRTDMELSLGSNGTSLFVRNFAYTDPALFKAAMSGIMLLYEVATLTTETASPYHSPQICDPDGTEAYITDGIPVGHETEYYQNNKLLEESLNNKNSLTLGKGTTNEVTITATQLSALLTLSSAEGVTF